MKPFFKSITVLFIALLPLAQHIKAQEYINPGKNLSVCASSDTLVFRELESNKLLYTLAVKQGAASHYVKFSPSGNLMITSGAGSVTNIYTLHKDTATLTASIPLNTQEAVFNSFETELFLLQSRSTSHTVISAYSIKSWQKLTTATLPFLAHDLTIDALGALLGFCEGNNIRTVNTWNLSEDKVVAQKIAPRLLVFNPALAYQCASVNEENLIQIRDLKKDTLIWEIRAHKFRIVWLGYNPTGNLLVSLDQKGYLFTWTPAKRTCIAQLKGVGGIPVFKRNGTLHLSSSDTPEEPGFVQHNLSKTR